MLTPIIGVALFGGAAYIAWARLARRVSGGTVKPTGVAVRVYEPGDGPAGLHLPGDREWRAGSVWR